jgi:hypothetical protein
MPTASEELELSGDDVVMEKTGVPQTSGIHATAEATRARGYGRDVPQASLPPTTTGRFAASAARVPPPPLTREERTDRGPLVAVAAQPEPSAGGKLNPHLVWAGVALVALAVVGWGMTQRREEAPRVVATQPSIQVVQTARPTPPLPEPMLEPEPEAPARELVPAATKPAALASGASARTPRPSASRSAPDAAQLTRAFGRQQGAIATCFEQHAAGLSGMPVVTLEFSLKAEGTLASVTLQPAGLAATGLGQCIQRVASQTRFPAPGSDVAFAIPVRASKNAQPSQP